MESTGRERNTENLHGYFENIKCEFGVQPPSYKRETLDRELGSMNWGVGGLGLSLDGCKYYIHFLLYNLFVLAAYRKHAKPF